MNYSSLRTPINISLFSGFWKWGKVFRGFICFANFSIIAAMLSKISYFHCRTFFIHQPRKKLKCKIFSSITEQFPQTYTTTTCQVVQHTWMICVARNSIWTLLIIAFCFNQQVTLATVTRTACPGVRSMPVSQRLPLSDTCKPQQICQVWGKGAGTDVTNHLSESFSGYLIMDRFVCNFEWRVSVTK